MSFINNSSRRILITTSVFLLGAITVLNLNGLADMTYDVRNILSPIILLFSVIIISLVPRRIKREAWPVLKYYYYFIFFFIIYGALSAYLNGVDTGRLYDLVRSNLASIIVVTAATFGFSYYAKFINRTDPLDYLYVLSMLSVGSIFYGRFNPDIHAYARYGDMLESRLSGFFANPNGAGMAACVAAVFCLFYLANRTKPMLNFFLLFLSGIGVFMTFSRAGILTFMFVVLFYLMSLLFSKENKRLGFSYLILFGLLVAGAIDFVQESDKWDYIQQTRINSMVKLASSGEVSRGENSRVDLLTVGGSMIEESPILGHGLGALQLMAERGLGVHNSFLVIQGEVGLFGSLLFILFIFQMVRLSFSVKDAMVRRFIFSYLFVFLSMLFFQHGGLTERNHNYYLGIIIAIICMSITQRKIGKREFE